MMGLVEEGEETIEEGKEKTGIAADLRLIAAAQKVEHYEISGYGTARSLARQIGEPDVATLLEHTLGEEESADSGLTLQAADAAGQFSGSRGGDQNRQDEKAETLNRIQPRPCGLDIDCMFERILIQ